MLHWKIHLVQPYTYTQIYVICQGWMMDEWFLMHTHSSYFLVSEYLTSQSRLHNECSDHDNDISASRDSQSKQRAAKKMGTTGHVQDTIYWHHQDKVKQGQTSSHILWTDINDTFVKGSDRLSDSPELNTKKRPEVTRDTGRPHRRPLLQLRPRPTRPPLLLPFRRASLDS